MKKIWICGAYGHLGTALQKLMNTGKYELFMTGKEEVDVASPEQVRMYMQRNRPDVVINCAAITDLQECMDDPDEAYRVNSLGARNLATEANYMSCKLIQLSTDDVFSGKENEPLNEFDYVKPRTIYGKSKLAGEQFILSMTNNFVILRSSWVYGTGKDYVDQVMRAVKDNVPFRASINQFSSPTSATELAKVVMEFVENDLNGIYHAVCKGSCSRYELAREIVKDMGSDIEVFPISEADDCRPVYSVLDNMMLRLDGVPEPCDWKVALKAYLDTLKQKGGYIIE